MIRKNLSLFSQTGSSSPRCQPIPRTQLLSPSYLRCECWIPFFSTLFFISRVINFYLDHIFFHHASSVILHWIVMNAEHGRPAHPSSPRGVWHWASSLRCTVIRDIPVYDVSQTRKQPKQWAVDGRHDENLSLVSLIMERSRWLGENSMRWMYDGIVHLKLGQKIEGEAREVTC